MDEIRGSGSAELLDDLIFKAVRDTSAAAC